jgi:hypothetical protein
VGRLVLLAVVIVSLWAGTAAAHNLPYALVSMSFPRNDEVRLELRAHVPSMILGLDQDLLDERQARSFLTLSDAQLQARQAEAAAALLRAMSLRADGALLDDISVTFPTAAELRIDAVQPRLSPRPSQPIILQARLPRDTRTVDLAMPSGLGAVVLHVTHRNGVSVSEALTEGARSRPVRLSGPDLLRDAFEAFASYLRIGFIHILPLGLDHILFVVALVLATPRIPELVKLATAFTVAHSITLALGALRWVEAPPWLVEPAISASIAAVAIGTVLRPARPAAPQRMGLVFGFGLLHGLGFAGVLSEVGLPRGLEGVGLAGFNLGVELGQLAVIAAALALIGWWRNRPEYRTRIAMPFSALIAVGGIGWTFERVLVLATSSGPPGF